MNISTTGWIRSTAHNDNCFGEFDTIDLSTLNDLRRAVQCAESNTKAESLGRVDQTFSLGNDFERKVTSGPHTGVCSETNHIFGNVTCEFTLDFTVKDGGLINVSAPTTPTRPVNHAPVALNQHVTTEANKQVQVALGATDIDLDDSLSAAIVTPPHPDHGSVGQIDQNTGKVTYTPAPGFSGNDSFAFKVTDSHQAGSNVATVSITILPSPKPSPIPTPTVTCDPKSKTIQNGAKGPKVIELQTDLTALGYGELLGKHGPKQVGIDGIFGDDTKKAVIKFQQDNHLKKIDGIVGPETWGAICGLLSPVKPSSNVKETMHNFHQIIFVTPTDGNQENLGTTYHQAALEQEASLRPQSENISDSFQEPENETDFPVGDFRSLGNLSETELEYLAKDAMSLPENATQVLPENATQVLPENATQVLPENATQVLPENATQVLPENATQVLPENATQVLPENATQVLPENATQVLPENATQVLPENATQVLPENATQVLPENATQVLPENATQVLPEAPTNMTPSEQVCADGSLPDVNGLCPDGNSPPAMNTPP